MKAFEGRNNVKVYNLSAGKSLPDWLTDRKRRQLKRRDAEFSRRIELIQDFTMPDISHCIRISPDGRYIIATGTYKPKVKCYEVASLSQKFERGLDAETIKFEILSEDYSKIVFMQQDRYIEFHYQGGRWFRMRIPKFGRDMAYHFPSCDLYMAASGSEIYRLNLSQGKFLNSLQLDSAGANCCAFNKVHYLFTCGTEDGRVEAWDPRSRHRVGVLDCAVHMISENIPVNEFKNASQLGVTSMAYSDALTLGVGTQTGQVLLYDIRSPKPLLVKDHNDGLPIIDLEFHNTSGKVLSMSNKIVKIWDKETGEPHTSIESGVDYNDLCVVPNSGMMFMATEDEKMQTYFLPSLGTAPNWCSHLDALIEELEEEDAPSQYDDYKFVTEEELRQIGLHDLIGTEMLRAVMHGYYIDSRLYSKAKLIANPFDYDDFVKRKVKQKITEQNQRAIQTNQKLPKVNQELYKTMMEFQQMGKRKKGLSREAMLNDDRFAALFSNEDFQINKSSEEFQQINPRVTGTNKKRQMQQRQDQEEEREFLKLRKKMLGGESSESESSDSEDEDEKPVEPKPKVPTEKHSALKEKEKYLEKKKKVAGKKKKVTFKNGETENKDLNFEAADSLSEFKTSKKKIRKMTLADRLDMEDDNQESVKQLTFGSREMTFTLKKGHRYEKMRKEQKVHHEERRKLRRSTASIKGKIRMKE